MEGLIEADGHEKAAPRRQFAEEQLEHRGAAEVVIGIGLQHRKLVKVGEQQAFPIRHVRSPRRLGLA
jgi:hypothetical protein